MFLYAGNNTRPLGAMQSVFLPQTTPAPEQTRHNFTIFDNPVLDLLASAEAEKVCSKMLLIYARLKRADWKLWERPGVLYFGGDDYHTAWESLCELAGVASATLAKALKWMAEKKVIAYFARKNGAGIRIYFNLALASLKPKQKNLTLVPTSAGSSPASANEAPSWEDNVFPKNNQNSDLDASRGEEPPATPSASEKPSHVVTGGATEGTPVAHTRPTLQLVPPIQPPSPSPALERDVEAVAQKLGQLESAIQAVLNLARSMPDKNFLLNQLAGKVGRVSAETVLRVLEPNKTSNAYVGAAPTPVAPVEPRPPVVHTEFWAARLAEISTRVNSESYKTWFAPLNAQAVDGVARIQVPDQVFADWLETNYAEVLDASGLERREWEVG